MFYFRYCSAEDKATGGGGGGPKNTMTRYECQGIFGPGPALLLVVVFACTGK